MAKSFGKNSRINRRGSDDDLQVRPFGKQLPQVPQNEIDIQ